MISAKPLIMAKPKRMTIELNGKMTNPKYPDTNVMTTAASALGIRMIQAKVLISLAVLFFIVWGCGQNTGPVIGEEKPHVFIGRKN